MLFVIGLLDSTSNQKLESIRNKTEPLGISRCSLYGHITFATYSGIDDTEFILSCKEILRNTKPFTIHFENLAQLPNTSILTAHPQKEKEVVNIHKKILDVWRDSLTPWTQEGIWQPHVTLLNDSEADLYAALHIMQKSFTPFDAKISRIEFSRSLENGFEIIDAVDLI